MLTKRQCSHHACCITPAPSATHPPTHTARHPPHRAVQRLVAVWLGRGNVVLAAPLHALPQAAGRLPYNVAGLGGKLLGLVLHRVEACRHFDIPGQQQTHGSATPAGWSLSVLPCAVQASQHHAACGLSPVLQLLTAGRSSRGTTMARRPIKSYSCTGGTTHTAGLGGSPASDGRGSGRREQHRDAAAAADQPTLAFSVQARASDLRACAAACRRVAQAQQLLERGEERLGAAVHLQRLSSGG